jgi:phosphocarrier protein HPr
MISKQYIITAADGIHARPAGTLIKMARKYKSDISMHKGNNPVKLNSMLNILSLGIKGGDTITVIMNGEDEAQAAAEIDSFFNHELNKL